MLGAYVAVLQSDPDVASKIKFRFFLLPNSAAPRRMCASYLCSVDPWFAKTVAVGLKGPVACAGGLDQNTSTSVPAVAGAATVAETMIDTSFRLPPLFLHSLLNDYMMARHANQLMVLLLCVFQVSPDLVFFIQFFSPFTRFFNVNAGKSPFRMRRLLRSIF